MKNNHVLKERIYSMLNSILSPLVGIVAALVVGLGLLALVGVDPTARSLNPRGMRQIM